MVDEPRLFHGIVAATSLLIVAGVAIAGIVTVVMAARWIVTNWFA
jgi:hypothetical protein